MGSLQKIFLTSKFLVTKVCLFFIFFAFVECRNTSIKLKLGLQVGTNTDTIITTHFEPIKLSSQSESEIGEPVNKLGDLIVYLLQLFQKLCLFLEEEGYES